MFLLSRLSWEVLRIKFEEAKKKKKKKESFKNLFCESQIFSIFKDKLPKMLLSWLVYKYKGKSCNATYYVKTIRHFKVQIS